MNTITIHHCIICDKNTKHKIEILNKYGKTGIKRFVQSIFTLGESETELCGRFTCQECGFSWLVKTK